MFSVFFLAAQYLWFCLIKAKLRFIFIRTRCIARVETAEMEIGIVRRRGRNGHLEEEKKVPSAVQAIILFE